MSTTTDLAKDNSINPIFEYVFGCLIIICLSIRDSKPPPVVCFYQSRRQLKWLKSTHIVHTTELYLNSFKHFKANFFSFFFFSDRGINDSKTLLFDSNKDLNKKLNLIIVFKIKCLYKKQKKIFSKILWIL